MKNVVFSVPHSGETIPEECSWLKDVDELTLLTDVDRFVDELYSDLAKRNSVPLVKSEISRYVVDLNRHEKQFDVRTVKGHPEIPEHSRLNLYWQKTTEGDVLLSEPHSFERHSRIIESYFKPFYQKLAAEIEPLNSGFLHMDLHSMPSVPKDYHNDTGEVRKDFVICNREDETSSRELIELLSKSLQAQGFSVSINWPYLGGEVVKRFSNPSEHKHSIMVEINRKLYMNEKTREKSADYQEFKSKLESAIQEFLESASKLQSAPFL